MRFKTAAALLLLGLLTLLAGIGQQTIWAPPETFTASVAGEAGEAPLTVIDQELRTLHGGPVRINVQGDGNFLLAVGRPGDVDAWVGATSHNTITGISEDHKALQVEHTDGEATAPSPAGSDLWVSTENSNGQLEYTWTAPADGEWSLLLAGDGTAAAPTDISMTFPNDTSTPWALPLMVAGAVLLLAGLVLLALGMIRGKGASRDDPGTNGGSSGPAAKASASRRGPSGTDAAAGTESRSAGKRGNRLGITAAAVTAAVVMATGAPALATTSTPTGSATPDAAVQTSTPVLLESQLRRILEQVASTVDAGDAAKDAAKLEPRVAGPELKVRAQNYKISAAVGSSAARPPVRATTLRASAVTEDTDWPRSVMAVTLGEGNPTEQVLTLVQASPRENYKLTQTTLMQPAANLPVFDRDGTPTVAADDKSGLSYSGEEALAALGDRLTSADSAFKDKLKDGPGNSAFIAGTLDYQEQTVAAGPNGTFTFTHKADPESTTVFRTSDGGALVLGTLTFAFEGTPKAEGDKLNVDEDAAVLAGGTETTTGMVLNSTESVAVYVPPAGSSDPMQLVAANVALVEARFK